MYSEFEKKYSRAISKLVGILLVIVFLFASVPFFFIAPDLTLGPINILGATITIVFSPFLFFGLNRYFKNRDASIFEALRAKNKTFNMPPYGHTISLSQLVFGLSCFLLLPIYFTTIHMFLVTKAINQLEIDGGGVVTKSENGISQVTFANMGKEYVVKVPDSIKVGKRVYISIPPNEDVRKARIFSVRGPHTVGGMVVMGGMHFVLCLLVTGVLVAIFLKLKPGRL